MPTPIRSPKLVYPRPQLVHDHAVLFKEPAYEDGQPYDGDDEDEEPSIITA